MRCVFCIKLNCILTLASPVCHTSSIRRKKKKRTKNTSMMMMWWWKIFECIKQIAHWQWCGEANVHKHNQRRTVYTIDGLREWWCDDDDDANKFAPRVCIGSCNEYLKRIGQRSVTFYGLPRVATRMLWSWPQLVFEWIWIETTWFSFCLLLILLDLNMVFLSPIPLFGFLNRWPSVSKRLVCKTANS